MPATLVLEETGLEIEGVIDSVDNTVDPATGTIQVRGVFPNPDASWSFPGSSSGSGSARRAARGRAAGRGDRPRHRPRRPLPADRRRRATSSRKRYVDPGPLEDGHDAGDPRGARAGERYIIEGLQRARPGMPVTRPGARRDRQRRREALAHVQPLLHLPPDLRVGDLDRHRAGGGPLDPAAAGREHARHHAAVGRRSPRATRAPAPRWWPRA